MTVNQLQVIRRAGLEPAAVEILEDRKVRMKLRDKNGGLEFWIGKAGSESGQNPKRLGESEGIAAGRRHSQ